MDYNEKESEKMTKKLEMERLITSLEKVSRKTKKKIWKDLAERLSKPRRNNVVVNIRQLNIVAKKNKGKVLLVPGKILSQGDMEEKVHLVALNASQKAIEKIEKAKGKFEYLKDFANEKVKVNEIIMVK
jgi:large subunit ribosomal protein L18e